MTSPQLPSIGTPPGSVLSDIILWVRRILKSQSDQSISDSEIVNYINRFYQFDMPARIQLFELKRQYTFETIPNVFIYQVPYAPPAINSEGDPDVVGDDGISLSRQGYQMLMAPAYCDGIQLGYFQSNEQFRSLYPELVMNAQPTEGDGSRGPYSITFAQSPVIRGFTDDLGILTPYVFFTSTDSDGEMHYVVDDGTGALIATDSTFQNGPGGLGDPVVSAGSVDYINGTAEVTFDEVIVDGQKIYCQTTPYSPGRPSVILNFNNELKIFPIPDRAYKIVLDCYITPAQFLNTTDSIQFSYMSEYIARGAARKALSDNAEIELFNFYEPLFREQENQVLRRTERQRAVVRTPTIFSGVRTTQNGSYFRNY